MKNHQAGCNICSRLYSAIRHKCDSSILYAYASCLNEVFLEEYCNTIQYEQIKSLIRQNKYEDVLEHFEKIY